VKTISKTSKIQENLVKIDWEMMNPNKVFGVHEKEF